jgi:thiol-disulfide isomerase/thioredoxin
MAVLDVNDSNFKEELGDGVALVKYYADWCGNCKLFAPKFKRVSNEESSSDIRFLDVDAEKNPEARKAAKVDNLPFLAVFKNGELVEGAASSKEEFLRQLMEKGRQA